MFIECGQPHAMRRLCTECILQRVTARTLVMTLEMTFGLYLTTALEDLQPLSTLRNPFKKLYRD